MDNDTLLLICEQIYDKDLFDVLFSGLNEEQKGAILKFVYSRIYQSDEEG